MASGILNADTIGTKNILKLLHDYENYQNTDTHKVLVAANMSLVWSLKLTSRWISVKSCLRRLIAPNIMSNERRTRLINELSRFIAVLITSPLIYRPAAEVNSS